MSCMHIKTDVITIRVYDDGDCYVDKDKYIGIVTGYILSNTRIHLTSAHGEFSLEVIREIQAELRNMGFKTINFEKHNIYTTKDLK